jgi:hypothetical protein
MWALASTSQITWAAPPVRLLNIDKYLHPAQQGSGGLLLAIFTKVCFFPSSHSRVYPGWFNCNFPCVRQIKEESRNVAPSTLFTSLTNCSSPNPRAAVAVAAHRSCKMQGPGSGELGVSPWDGTAQPGWQCEPSRCLKNRHKLSQHHLFPASIHREHSQTPPGKTQSCQLKVEFGG